MLASIFAVSRVPKTGLGFAAQPICHRTCSRIADPESGKTAQVGQERQEILENVRGTNLERSPEAVPAIGPDISRAAIFLRTPDVLP